MQSSQQNISKSNLALYKKNTSWPNKAYPGNAKQINVIYHINKLYYETILILPNYCLFYETNLSSTHKAKLTTYCYLLTIGYPFDLTSTINY